MRFPIRRRFYKFLPALLSVLLLACLFSLSTPPAALAAGGDLTISGPGLNNSEPVTFTQQQLRGDDPLSNGDYLPQHTEIYGTINTWPTKSWYAGEGVKLSDLLAVAGGLKPEATQIKFTSSDGFQVTFTVQEFVYGQRYRFPHFMDNGVAGQIPGDPSGAVAVEPIIAHRSCSAQNMADVVDDENMSRGDANLLLFGQQAVTQQTNALFAKYVTGIEVLTTPVPKWGNPTAVPAAGEVPLGTMVELHSTFDDLDKVHYTTDGSEPTLNSPMYNWISSRWWSSRGDVLDEINRKIGPLNSNTTIKAVVIGPGRADSDIVAFDYTVPGTVSDTAPPAWEAGSNLSAVVTDSSVALNWPAATDNVGVTQYEVYKNDVVVDTVSSATRSYTVADLEPGSYTFSVKALDAAGNRSEALTAGAIIEPVGPVALTITGDGVTTPKTFTMAQLQGMEQYQHLYSVINTYPSKSWYVASGVKLAKLLEAAGIKDEAKLITVTASDGYRLIFTRKELLEDSRYYYPGLKENAEYDGSIAGSPDGAQPVETILALRSAESNNFDNMNTSSALHLVMGQRWVTEQTNHAFVKKTSTIEVSTATPAKWANPIAEPAEGTVAAGTRVIFNPVNINDMDSANFHYTTDGSDPTFASPMYNWVKYRWWDRPDLESINRPIELNRNMTIKAVVIGFGKEDSDIVTFNYQVPVVISTENPAGGNQNGTYAGHTFTARGGVGPYSFAVTAGTLPAGMALNGAVLEGTPVERGTFAFTITVTDSSDPAETDSHEFTLVVDFPASPALTADTTDNKEGQNIDITFTDDADWRAAISGIKVGDTTLSSGQYTVGEGNINIIADAFPIFGNYLITVQATGYTDATVSQEIKPAGEFVVLDGVLILYQGAGGAAIIPGNLGITSIGDAVFENLSSLTSVSIPTGVTSIGNSAFRNCDNLTSVSIPEGVTSIGTYAFYNCSKLSSVSIPQGVTSIGTYAFRGCSSLSSITIPGSVTSIEARTFDSCNGLNSVVISEGVTSIGTNAFYNCSSLSSISIPQGVTSIGNYAFSGCTSLSSVTLPGSVASIGTYAFSGCSSLSSISIPQGVTSIGNYAFNGCTSLSSVTLPGSVTSIGTYAFRGCSSLGSISIPEGVTSIGSRTFDSCSSLSSISIPGSVTSIGTYAFNGCTSLSSVTLPGSVTSIGGSAFSGCSSLTSVNIPAGLTSIGTSAFSGCSSLTSPIIIPSTVSAIANNAFNGCSSLTSVTIPRSVTTIGNSSFQGCSNLTIYGYSDSTAQTYAAANGIPFVDLDAVAPAPALAADTTENTVGNSIEITFADDEAWRNAIAAVTVNDSLLESGEYAVEAGKLTIAAGVFTEAGDYAIVVSATGYSDAMVTQQLLAAPVAPPVLTADTTGNELGQAVDITFTDDADWRAAITGITVEDSVLSSAQYTVTAGNINITADVFTAVGDYAVVVTATGYSDAVVIQTIITGPGTNPVYTVTPKDDPAYTAGTTPDGITTMTVNAGVSGLKYFSVQVEPVTAHDGLETVIFTHLRNGEQLSLNATRADFDAVETAQAGFNVQPGDIVKAYIVDDLINALDSNPTLLQ